jgi:hypothetical protein
MNAITINIETFKSEDGVSGTIDLTINGETQTVDCYNQDLRSKGRAWTIIVGGLACKFQTGTKVWPATITYWPEQNIFTQLGPVNYSRVNGGRRRYQLVGFKNHFTESENRSQHNGGYKN